MAVTLSSEQMAQKVEFVKYESSTLPQTGTEDMASVSGVVQITNIIGIVTDGVQAQANNLKLGFDAGGGSNDIAAALDINGDAQFTMYSITGTPTDAIIEVTDGIHNAMPDPLVFFNGKITWSCSASNTGEIEWYITYIPLSPGATITAA